MLCDPITNVLQYGSAGLASALALGGMREHTESLLWLSSLAYRFRSFLAVIPAVDSLLVLMELYNAGNAHAMRQHGAHVVLLAISCLSDYFGALCDVTAFCCSTFLKAIAVQRHGKRVNLLRRLLWRVRAGTERLSDVMWSISLISVLVRLLKQLRAIRIAERAVSEARVARAQADRAGARVSRGCSEFGVKGWEEPPHMFVPVEIGDDDASATSSSFVMMTGAGEDDAYDDDGADDDGVSVGGDDGHTQNVILSSLYGNWVYRQIRLDPELRGSEHSTLAALVEEEDSSFAPEMDTNTHDLFKTIAQKAVKEEAALWRGLRREWTAHSAHSLTSKVIVLRMRIYFLRKMLLRVVLCAVTAIPCAFGINYEGGLAAFGAVLNEVL